MAVSLTDIRRNRQEQASFTGREAELEGFRHNFELSFENAERKFIFAISGQGGIGKTSLLRRFREIAKNNDALIALTDESFNDLPTVLQRFAEDLEKQGFPLKNFTERYRLYRQKQQDLDNDPDLLRLRLTGRALEHKKGSIITNPLKSAKDVAANLLPFPYNVPLALLNEENLIEHASEWTAQVARKLGNKDEVGLLQKPLEFLTPLFLSDLQSIAGKRQVAFFFDTFEQTGNYLEPWLLRLIEGQYGDLPANVVLVLAGRDALDPQRWRENEGLMVRIPLAPFTQTEAEAFLQSKQVTNPQVVEQILNLSSRLPLLVSILADQKPTDPQQIGDPCSTAVDRFLRWEDPLLQQLAMDAALPRRLNQDLIALLTKEEEQARTLFTWLKGRPFVQERVGGWGYHDVVREQMLRHKQREAPQGWAKLHQQLAEYYEKLRDDLGLEEEKGWKDETWQSYALEALYHRLCQAPQKYLAFALNGYLTALGEEELSFAQAWAESIKEAGQDTGARAKEVKKWGERLVEGLVTWEEDRYEGTVATFTALLENPTIEAKGRAAALKERGFAYRRMGKYEEALADLTSVLELDPNDVLATAERGGTYWRMGKHEEALADFTRAIELKPDNTWAIASRARAYQKMGKHEEAIVDSTRAIELKPDDTLLISLRAEAYQEMGKYEEALADFTRAIELRPYATSPIIDRAKAYQEMGKYEEALADFNRAIELKPDETSPIIDRARAYQEMGKYEEAIADLNRAIELKPDDAWAITRRGQTYQKMGKYEEALADFTRAIELKPYYNWAFLYRGQTYQKMGKYEEALADFTRAIELMPDHTWAIINRAIAYQMMGKYEEAIADFNRAIELKPDETSPITNRAEAYQEMGKYDEAIADFTRAIELKPDDAWAITHRARAYQRMGKHEEALADFTRVIELKPDDTWAITNRAEAYQEMGKYDEAIADLTRVIELKPDDTWAIIDRAKAYQEMGKHEEAIADFTHAIELKPDETSLIIDRAEAYQKMGKHEEALADFTHAIELKPDETSPIANRARAYQGMGKHEEAIVDFTRAIALKHDDTTFLLILRAAAYQEMGKYEEALADCTRALELYPDDTWAITNRARAYQKMGKYEEALADLNRAIELDPDYAWAFALRGETYQLMGKYEEALADLTRALELNPEYAWPYYLRALTFHSLGQTEKVAEDLAKAIELGQKGYESNPTDWQNGFNLAIYHLAAGDFVAATKLYHEGLAGGASQGNLREAIRDLDQFLGVFPNHAEALALKAELEGALK